MSHAAFVAKRDFVDFHMLAPSHPQQLNKTSIARVSHTFQTDRATMTPSQWQEYLYELLKALYIVILSAAALYTSQYVLKWTAEKIKQTSLMLVPWELEQDLGGDRNMVLGLDVRPR